MSRWQRNEGNDSVWFPSIVPFDSPSRGISVRRDFFWRGSTETFVWILYLATGIAFLCSLLFGYVGPHLVPVGDLLPYSLVGERLLGLQQPLRMSPWTTQYIIRLIVTCAHGLCCIVTSLLHWPMQLQFKPRSIVAAIGVSSPRSDSGDETVATVR